MLFVCPEWTVWIPNVFGCFSAWASGLPLMVGNLEVSGVAARQGIDLVKEALEQPSLLHALCVLVRASDAALAENLADGLDKAARVLHVMPEDIGKWCEPAILAKFNSLFRESWGRGLSRHQHKSTPHNMKYSTDKPDAQHTAELLSVKLLRSEDNCNSAVVQFVPPSAMPPDPSLGFYVLPERVKDTVLAWSNMEVNSRKPQKALYLKDLGFGVFPIDEALES